MTVQEKHVFGNILEAIGNTPIIRMNKVGADLPCELYAKLEFMNPGGSIKDRIGYWLIEDFERRGLLKPGGTIVEGTSGNTGFGIAIAAAIKGYQCIFTLADKMSEEKIRALRAFGARVVVCPTAVAPEDPRSYYSTARRLAKETPNSIYVDQYNNTANRDCHSKMTGPEILRQMPDVDYIVAGIGTGGTVCGIGMHLRDKESQARMIAVDPLGSIVYDKFKNNRDVHAQTYKVEGIGEDFFPKNYDFSVIHDMVQIEDKESFNMTREMLTKEGIYAGVSSGAAMIGAIKWIKKNADKVKGKKVLVILPDSGNRYLSKVYDDDWMREAGFLDTPTLGTVSDLLRQMGSQSGGLIQVRENEKVSAAIDLMREKGISQMPVVDEKGWVKGVVTETHLLKSLYSGRTKATQNVGELADSSVEFVTGTDSIEKISRLVTAGKTPLVSIDGKLLAVITKIDLLSYIGSRA